METEKKERNSFTNSIGFVLAAAGSAVGLGNIWRFPYLAAKDGGGLFLLVYLILALTFGFTLLVTEVAIGRKTQQSPLTAYSKLNSKWGFLGIFSFVVPMIIYPYYCVIGGWVIKYMVTYLSFQSANCINPDFFGGFITAQWQPVFFCLLFAAACFVIVYKGVEHGIEKYSRILMPILVILILFIAIFVLFIKDPESGRTGLQGAKIYFVPSFEGITFKKFFFIVIDALTQLFYSLSIAMGIMVAYGSYMKKSSNLAKSVDRIQIFDTGIALLAGLMIIPAVFVFQGKDGLTASGPGLMFQSLPKVFAKFGAFGDVLGIIFFVMVLFAALTSAVSILEACVSSMIDKFNWTRKKATIVMAAIGFVISIVVCLGYNIFYFELKFPNGTKGQILDVLDYASNYILMPITAILTCILIGWVVKPKKIVKEIQRNDEPFRRRGLYIVMIKVIAPVLLFFILLTNFGVFNKVYTKSIFYKKYNNQAEKLFLDENDNPITGTIEYIDEKSGTIYTLRLIDGQLNGDVLDQNGNLIRQDAAVENKDHLEYWRKNQIHRDVIDGDNPEPAVIDIKDNKTVNEFWNNGNYLKKNKIK